MADLYAEITDRIATALESGVAPWVKPWSAMGEGGPDRNGASGHVYRGINVLLTRMAGFGCPRWYTFNQAKGLGACVRKGEKGTKVVYWAFVEPKERKSEDEGNDRKIPILRCYTVFNALQIEWPEGHKHAVVVGDPPVQDFPRVAEKVADTGACIRHGGDMACFSPNEDIIRMPDPDAFKSPADYWATVLHELTHWTGHMSRLDRQLGNRFGSEAYAMEELVAELGAAFLCTELGVEGQLQHVEYLAHWAKVLREDKRAIFTASRMAQDAAAYLLKAAGDEEAEVEVA